MSDTNFNLLSMSQSASVTVEQITGSHDALHAYLHIPLSLTLRATPHSGFDLLPINALLSFQQPYQPLSESTGPWGTSVYGNTSNPGFVLKFKLDERQLHFIETNRAGELPMLLELTFHIFQKNGGIQTEQAKLNFMLPRSVWVEKILPQLGYKNLKLIEIPLTNDGLKEAYGDIITEFNKAEYYFNLQDYSKCVAHCRCTMDKLTGQLKLIKEITKSGTAFKWLQTVNNETLAWIEHIHKASHRKHTTPAKTWSLNATKLSQFI